MLYDAVLYPLKGSHEIYNSAHAYFLLFFLREDVVMIIKKNRIVCDRWVNRSTVLSKYTTRAALSTCIVSDDILVSCIA